MTDKKSIKEKLIELARLDIDSATALHQAVKNSGEVQLREQLEEFSREHERHADELGQAIGKMGGLAPARAEGFEGFLNDGFLPVKGPSERDALKAVLENEKKTGHAYEEIGRLDLGRDLQTLIFKLRGEEKSHIIFLERSLGENIG